MLASGCWRLLAVGHKEGTVQATCRCLGASKLLHFPVVFVENVNLYTIRAVVKLRKTPVQTKKVERLPLQ